MTPKSFWLSFGSHAFFSFILRPRFPKRCWKLWNPLMAQLLLSTAPKSSTKWCTGVHRILRAKYCKLSAHRLKAQTQADAPKQSAVWHQRVAPLGVNSIVYATERSLTGNWRYAASKSWVRHKAKMATHVDIRVHCVVSRHVMGLQSTVVEASPEIFTTPYFVTLLHWEAHCSQHGISGSWFHGMAWDTDERWCPMWASDSALSLLLQEFLKKWLPVWIYGTVVLASVDVCTIQALESILERLDVHTARPCEETNPVRDVGARWGEATSQVFT